MLWGPMNMLDDLQKMLNDIRNICFLAIAQILWISKLFSRPCDMLYGPLDRCYVVHPLR